jgi:hypothetical protein
MARTTTVTYTPASVVLPEWEYTVHLFPVSDLRVEPVDDIVAAYFQEQGSMILFKDAEHTVVRAFQASSILQIVRGDDPVDDE